MLGITIPTYSKNNILEKIKKYIRFPKGFFHIVSLNPEILVIANHDEKFKKAVETAQIRIIDGIGIVLAAQILNIKAGARLTGVELMEELVRMADAMRLRVMLIGGRSNLALKLADCYSKELPEAKFKGVYGIGDIKNPKKEEEEAFFSIVRRYKPHIILAAFGSPDQELWLERHKKEFSGIICAGVGGAFDYLGGNISRPPKAIQRLGLEWLYRLIRQPWRWRRQLRLIEFLWLVLKQRAVSF